MTYGIPSPKLLWWMPVLAIILALGTSVSCDRPERFKIPVVKDAAVAGLTNHAPVREAVVVGDEKTKLACERLCCTTSSLSHGMCGAAGHHVRYRAPFLGSQNKDYCRCQTKIPDPGTDNKFIYIEYDIRLVSVQ